MHVSDPDGSHFVALRHIASLHSTIGARTFLDVGCGTGRGVQFLLGRSLDASGVDPVPELIAQGVEKGIPNEKLKVANGDNLPFPDASIDVVFECGVLHHVPDPSVVVSEMMRVARHAVCLSDSNRFGQGAKAVRMIKLCLYRAGLWNSVRFLLTRGKMFSISEGDGISYSYSVYDSHAQLAQWAKHIWVIPTVGASPGMTWTSPLLSHSHALLVATR